MNGNTLKENEIHVALETYSRSLVPSVEYINRGTTASQKIFELLKTEGRREGTLSVDRVFISGSIGKKTAITGSDFDCVIFVNIEKISEITEVLDQFQKILTSGLGLSSLKRTSFSVQFKYKGIDFDVIPAINLINHQPEQMDDPDRAAEMAFEVYKKLQDDPSLMYNYSSALVETSLRFMNEQGQDQCEASFIHGLVRLCKKFNKSLIINSYISGRSTFMEVIGVYAAHKELKRAKKQRKPPSLLNGFREFLNIVIQFPRVRIKFDKFDPLRPQRSSKDYSWLQRKNSPVLKKTMQHYYIMDPANPFNNLYKAVKYRQRRKFRDCARVGLKRLNDFAQNWSEIPIDSIFVPQIPRKNNPKNPFQNPPVSIGGYY